MPGGLPARHPHRTMPTAPPALREFCAEAGGAPPRLHALFRHAHSLKGLAGMSALSGIAAMAHQLEDVLDALRLGRQPWSPDVMGWLRESGGPPPRGGARR